MMTIWLPYAIHDDLRELMSVVHGRRVKVCTYLPERIKAREPRRMLEFLDSHKDADQFVYLADKTHVAEAMSHSCVFGWLEVDALDRIDTIYHHKQVSLHDKALKIQRVWGRPRRYAPMRHGFVDIH